MQSTSREATRRNLFSWTAREAAGQQQIPPLRFANRRNEQNGVSFKRAMIENLQARQGAPRQPIMARLVFQTFSGLSHETNSPGDVVDGLRFDTDTAIHADCEHSGADYGRLNGTWSTIVDPYENGLGSKFYLNAKPQTKSDLVEYDFDTSPKLKVPGDWNSQRESLFFYEGTVWYQRYFSYEKKEHTRLFLHFGAANYKTRVWLNGKELGEHIGGFTPFDFEIKDELSAGENSLVVEVNNQRLVDGVPTLSTDWWNYGGITRDVDLVEVPDTFVQDYFVQLAKGSSDQVAGWVRLSGAESAQTVTVEIPEINLKKSVTTDASGYAELHFSVKIKLWTPEDPKLYRVVISAGSDKVEDEIGFRTIETRGTQILLNGKPVYLRGICIHEEAAFRGGRAFSPEDDKTLLLWAKELGANYVRLAHYPHNEYMTRLADQLGLMVWSEIPAYWGIAWTNPGTLDNAQQQFGMRLPRSQPGFGDFVVYVERDTAG